MPNPLEQVSQRKEVDEFLSEMAADMRKSGMSEDTIAKKIEDGRSELYDELGISGGDIALDTAAKALDYTGGLTRAGIAQSLEGVLGKDLISKEDVQKGLSLEEPFPSSEQLIEKAGYGHHPYIGAAADIVLDPAILASLPAKIVSRFPKLAKAAKAIGRFATPVETAAKDAGKAFSKAQYGSVFAAPNAAAAKYGKKAVPSELMREAGIVRVSKAAENIAPIAEDLGKSVDNMVSEASKAGAKTTGEEIVRDAQKFVDDIADFPDPDVNKIAAELQRRINEIKAVGEVPVDKLNKWKRTQYEKLSSRSWEPGVKSSFYTQFDQALAHGMKTGVENAAEKAIPGLGNKIKEANDTWGALLSATPAVKKESVAAAKRGMFSGWDPAVASGAFFWGRPELFAAKKMYDLGTMPTGRLFMGKAAEKLAAPASSAAKRGLIELRRPE